MSFNDLYNILKPHQKYIVDKIINNYDNYQYFFISAPTGSGKTLTVLTILKWIQENHGYIKAFWYTRTHNEFYPIARDINKFNIKLSVIPVIGKLKICKNPLMRLFTLLHPYEICRECHYSKEIKMPELINKYINTQSINELLASIPKTLCPYYTLLNTSIDADIVLLTYPYLFGNPRKAVLSYNKPTIEVIDEAHNIENIPQILSLHLSVETLHRLKYFGYNIDSLTKLHANVLGENKMKHVSKELFKGTLMNVDKRLLVSCVDVSKIASINIEKAEVIAEFCNFVSAIDIPYFDIYATKHGFKLLVTDPYQIIHDLFETKTIFMSGSLPTKQYINDVWGIDGLYIDIEKEINFVFGERKWFIATDTTSKLALRKQYLNNMRRYVDTLLHKTKPIQLVVFPSYEYMNEFRDIAIKYQCIVEHERTRIEDVINEVKVYKRKCIFAVAGGKLTEGIEITDEHGRTMIKTIIMVGIPYPEPSDYLTRKEKSLAKRIIITSETKYRYLFHEPALILTKQAIGRGIRHEKDKNIIVLLDWRYRYFINDLGIKQFIEIVMKK